MNRDLAAVRFRHPCPHPCRFVPKGVWILALTILTLVPLIAFAAREIPADTVEIDQYFPEDVPALAEAEEFDLSGFLQHVGRGARDAKKGAQCREVPGLGLGRPSGWRVGKTDVTPRVQVLDYAGNGGGEGREEGDEFLSESINCG